MTFPQQLVVFQSDNQEYAVALSAVGQVISAVAGSR